LVCVLLAAGTMSQTKAFDCICDVCSGHEQRIDPAGTTIAQAQLPRVSSTSWPHSAATELGTAHRKLEYAHRRAHGAAQQQPTAAADGFMQELGVTYRYNDIPQGLSKNVTAEACAAACHAMQSATCVAWSWLPGSSSEHPSSCSLKSARGSVIESSPGAVSGYQRGEVPACNCCLGMCRAACQSASTCACL
jgi:hypothetical protein